MVVGEIFPRSAVRAVVLPDSPPLPLAQVRAPALPVCFPVSVLFEPLFFRCLFRGFSHQGKRPRRTFECVPYRLAPLILLGISRPRALELPQPHRPGHGSIQFYCTMRVLKNKREIIRSITSCLPQGKEGVNAQRARHPLCGLPGYDIEKVCPGKKTVRKAKSRVGACRDSLEAMPPFGSLRTV